VADNVTTLILRAGCHRPDGDGDGWRIRIGAAGYETVLFGLFDKHKVDEVTLNGVEKDLIDSPYSNLDGVKPGEFGSVLGPRRGRRARLDRVVCLHGRRDGRAQRPHLEGEVVDAQLGAR
jgi:hypothetical protein